MDIKEIKDKVVEIAEDKLWLVEDEVKLDKSCVELTNDPLDQIDFIMSLEENFNIKLGSEFIDKPLNEIIDFINTQII